ncbi:MAG: hypothetical protein KC466_02085, partial [Myxococcales bacterium]|nr:hypothetical protein [Myxococcales bacterium]
GVGIAADAYRYGVLRDQGYDAAEVEIARGHLVDALHALHLAMAITGTEGVIARGFIRTDIPGPGGAEPLTPLFDGEGNPLPPEKNNGTWRADNSGGEYPNYIFEDSCSRDMIIGWATAFGAAWEVIAEDPAFDEALKDRLRADAAALGRMMMTVQASGYDLEIQDADGRPTFHAYLNENAFDRYYLPFLPFKDGQHATMSLGIMTALAYASGDPDLAAYVDDALLGTRNFQGIIASNQLGADFGVVTNYSNVNMIAAGFWLTARYVPASRPDAREKVRVGLAYQFYDRPGASRQPKETMQSLYDLDYVAGLADGGAFGPASGDYDPVALAQAIETLHAFPEPPFWDIHRENCDADEIAANYCIADDGTELHLLGYVGRGDTLVALEPIPMRIRPPSNYFWRSNPYEPNGGGDGSRLLPGVDFRFVYWAGRWAR